MKQITAILIASVLLVSIVSASMLIPSSDNAKENAMAPETSVKITEGVDGKWWLNRADFIHHAKPDKPGKPDKPLKDNIGPACYKTFAKWPTVPVDYVINPTGSGWDPGLVETAISTSAETWDEETSAELFNDEYVVDDNEIWGDYDGKNVIDFGDYPQDGVIGVTSIWYDSVTEKIYEFDIRFDTDFEWGDCLETEQGCYNNGVMDLQNIATHELGHGVGMDDIYKRPCSAVTMYGYSSYGETEKRTLENADIDGLQTLYGA